MFRFENPYYLYLLIGIPAITLFYLWSHWRKKSALKKLGDSHLVLQLMPHYKPGKQWAKIIFILLALASLVIALANPQMGSRIEKVKRKGIDVFIALDVSKSMMAEDVKPNRLTRAKQAVKNIIEKLENDRVGLIIFAGRSYLQMPLTVDYSAATLYLNNANCDMVPTQGTAIGAAIDQATESFQTKVKKHKALIIITDGENHEDDAIDAAKAAVNEGVRIFTVGVGSAQGAPIPVYNGNVQTDFKKDENGSIVLSKLNEDALKEIATAGQGEYYTLTNSQDEVKSIIKTIGGMEQKSLEDKMFADYVDYFQYFLALTLILLLLEILIFETPTHWFNYLRRLIPIILICLFFSSNTVAQSSFFNPQPERKIARDALQKFKTNKLQLADTLNGSAIKLNKNFGEAYYNRAQGMYENKDYQKSAEQFKNAAALLKNKNSKAKALHNLGNSYMQQRQFTEAIDAYKNALKENPNDRDTKYNLAYAQAMLKNNPPKNNNKNDKKDKDKKQNKGNDNKDNKGNNDKKQEQNKEKKNEQDKNKGNSSNDKKEGEKQQPKPGKISKEDADRMLKNLRAEEQKTKQNADKKNTLVTRIKSSEKDW